MPRNFSEKLIIALISLSIVYFAFPVVLYAAEKDWSIHNPASTEVISHKTWDNILGAIAFEFARVNAQVKKSEWDCRETASRMTRCPERRETNRNMKGINFIPYDQIKPELAYFLGSYLNAMSRIDISNFNRNEQLAFWLNVHNAAVITRLYKDYPLDSIKSLRKDHEDNTDSWWNDKVIRVENVPLSLHEIEQEILFENWGSPLIVYGLFDGAVGSPKISKVAFKGWSVYSQLQEKAAYFVNSPRSLRLRGNKLNVSKTYDWARKLFKTDADLLAHIREYANDELRKDIASATISSRDLYDFELAAYRLPSDDWLVDLQRVQRHVEPGG